MAPTPVAASATELSAGLVDVAAGVAGRLLGAGASLAARARRPAKPFHPRGRVRTATLHRYGVGGSGVAWLDEAGRDVILVRQSRAVGLPAWLPDVHGLAVGVPLDDERADLLFATTGLGLITRFTLTAAWRPEARPMTTLLPYRSPGGALVLAAEAAGPDRYRLSWARPTGPWWVWGCIEIHAGEGDQDIAFDPVLHPVPGLEVDRWVQRLREPAYRAARSRRSENA